MDTVVKFGRRRGHVFVHAELAVLTLESMCTRYVYKNYFGTCFFV